MKYTGRVFNINYKGTAIKVEVYVVGKQEVMKVFLPELLFITKSSDVDSYDFWTSIPQGRQKLAEEIGDLIDSLAEQRKQDNNSFQTSLF